MLRETDLSGWTSHRGESAIDRMWPGPDNGLPALDTRPTLLIVGIGPDLRALSAMADGAGFRLTGTVADQGLAGHLRRMIGVDGLLVDLRGLGPADPRIDTALAALLGWPGWCDTRPLIMADIEAVERIAAGLALDFDGLLCDPAPSDIGMALCLLARACDRTARLHDISRDSDAARLDQLSAEVRRLAQTIDRLTRDEDDAAPRSLRARHEDYVPQPPADRPKSGEPGISRETDMTREEVRAILHARRLRDRFLPGDLFADPAWDMMLDLMGARLDGKRVSVSSLCIASAVPPTTALRWIAQLTQRGIFDRCNDPDDARRVFISLSDDAAQSLSGWYAAAQRTGWRYAG